MPISDWSTTPASNNAAPPNGWPENMAPSAVNDTARQMMADIRTQMENAEWFDHGDTVSRLSASTFQIAGDVTARYLAQRRIKCYDASTLYGTILSSSYSAPNTTVTVGLDSGSLTASFTSAALSIITPTNLSIPSTLGRKGTDIASAATTDIASATADFVDVTGTTTITALGTANAGVERTIRFTGALTLTHNGTSLILPGAVNITTANGDIAIFRSLGSGNWVCVSYFRASGANLVINFKGADIASAATVDLATVTGDFVDITGTTTITALGTVTAGIQKVLRFNGALTFTHNGTSLILPGGGNITTASGDIAIVRSLGSGNWVCINYTKADGTSVATSAPFVDSTAIIKGSVDSTKQLKIEVDGLTTATTRTITMPDRDITLGNLSWEKISTATASSSATIDFTDLSSTYVAYMVVLSAVLPATDNVNLLIRASTDNGSSFAITSYGWVEYGFRSGGSGAFSSGNTSDIAIPINAAGTRGLSNAAGEYGSFVVTILNAGTSNRLQIINDGHYISDTGEHVGVSTRGEYFGATSVDAIRFLMSSGNIASGTFTLYGIRG
jgi:predicted ribosome-associated RNA-binding protein Tma20